MHENGTSHTHIRIHMHMPAHHETNPPLHIDEWPPDVQSSRSCAARTEVCEALSYYEAEPHGTVDTAACPIGMQRSRAWCGTPPILGVVNMVGTRNFT